MFTAMFAVPRTSGWMAQWLEWMNDEERRIVRPRQIYTGPREADYVPMNER
jgi:citrate synthase